MRLSRLSLAFTSLAASGATAANLRSLFRGQKVLKLLTMGYALPEMPLSVGSKLELLCCCQTSVYSRISLRTLPCTTWACKMDSSWDGQRVKSTLPTIHTQQPHTDRTWCNVFVYNTSVLKHKTTPTMLTHCSLMYYLNVIVSQHSNYCLPISTWPWDY